MNAMTKKLTGILSSTKKSLILSLLAAGLIVLMAVFGVFVLKSHGAEQPAVCGRP